MYESHFHLSQTPFSIAPDPAFLYLSEAHQEALAHLMYGFSHGGFVLITGEVGTGKTTLLRNLVKQIPEDLDVAFVLNPRLTVRELLETLCDELGVDYPKGVSASVKMYIDALNKHLLETHSKGRGTVVIIDEAQNLSPAVLEQIRLLTNLETDKRKLLRIILLGQPELGELLSRNELRQLAQRITARYHLRGLSREDAYAYVVHRLARAGGSSRIFTRPALSRLYAISKGIPRVINLVADRALLGAYVLGRNRVTAGLVERAAGEVLGRTPYRRRWMAAGAAAATVASVAFAYFLVPRDFLSATDDWRPAQHAAGTAAPNDAAAPVGAGTEQNDVADDAAPALAEAPADAGPADEGTAVMPATPPVPADAAPPPPTSTGQPLVRPDMPAYQTQRLAYRAVFDRWGADLASWNSSTIPCNFAPSAGLQCLSRTGSWSDIRQMNLPVVLELWDKGSAPYYGAVTAMNDQGLVLQLGTRRFEVTTAELRDIWFGSYVVIWKMPPDYHGTLKRGDRHPSVRWLRSQLESLGAAQLQTAEPVLFDAALQDAVVAFQRDERLLADGIVGPATWISLGARLKLPAPALEG
jgi:general secretion pathway protein A